MQDEIRIFLLKYFSLKKSHAFHKKQEKLNKYEHYKKKVKGYSYWYFLCGLAYHIEGIQKNSAQSDLIICWAYFCFSLTGL